MSQKTTNIKSFWEKIRYSFPIQLVVLHLKKNHAILLIWIALIAILTGGFLSKYGASSLFLTPEYLGGINFAAYAIVGFATGGIMMAFNIYSYVTHGYRFPFIATIKKPFLIFSLNNSIIPFVYVLTFIFLSIKTLYFKELFPVFEIIQFILSYILGITLFVILSFTYFIPTNKDYYSVTGENENDQKSKIPIVDSALKIKARWSKLGSEDQWRVTTYFTSPFKVKIARSYLHYSQKLLTEIMSQHHTNASIFEVLMVGSFIVLGSFGSFELFEIPASASILLMLTIFMMLVSAIYSWFKGWTTTFMILGFILLNALSNDVTILKYINEAYGLNYSVKPIEYSHESLKSKLIDVNKNKQDSLNVIKQLTNWKLRQEQEKPKLVIVNTSGGGLRSALWTFSVLTTLDSVTNGEMSKLTNLITGASGGIIGAAYYRELLLERIKKNIEINNKIYKKKLSSDLLNPIVFSIATNDLFIRYKKFTYNNKSYTKDRAYAFEQALNDNLDDAFNKPLKYYAPFELSAQIPQMFITPTIANDGRRLLVSSQKSSYFSSSHSQLINSYDLIEYVDFLTFFDNHNAENVRFSSVLRMNATFPYILPIVSLPSNPKMNIMDAGLRDNFGIDATLKYLNIFSEWIQKNTSGVIIVRINDTDEEYELSEVSDNSIINRMVLPIQGLSGNFMNIQQYASQENLNLTNSWIKDNLIISNLNLASNSEENKISLSWRLSELEKNKIIKSIYVPNNATTIEELKSLIE